MHVQYTYKYKHEHTYNYKCVYKLHVIMTQARSLAMYNRIDALLDVALGL